MPAILTTQEADQEEHCSKPARTNSSRHPISKILNTELLHNKRNSHQNEEAAHRMGENFCQLYNLTRD
jgi:hypothetical protein